MSHSLPPRKIPFSQRREREFLYLNEIDAVIAAVAQTRAATRNTALALLLFCQALQPAELCSLNWSDVDFTENILKVKRIRTRPIHSYRRAHINLQPLGPVEVDILEKLHALSTTDWIFSSERSSRYSERSLHHLIQQAGITALISFPIHPYMLRNTGLFYRAAVLLEPTKLSLRQCCLLWNWHSTKNALSLEQEQEYGDIPTLAEDAFLAAIGQLRAFTGIQFYQNVIDYLLGAYALFPRLQGIPKNYWLAPISWYI